MARAQELTLQIITSEGVFENGQLVSGDYLGAFDEQKAALLISMLKELAIQPADFQNFTPPYLDMLAAPTRDILQGMQRAAEDPAQPVPVVATGERQQEFERIVQELRATGQAEHEKLRDTVNAYGSEAQRAEYTKPGGILDTRMKDHGYTLFALTDKADGRLVALASGDACDVKKQFRLRNIAVHGDYRKDEAGQNNHYGSELIAQVSHYAAQKGYDKVCMPLSINALAKGNPAIYASVAEQFSKGALAVSSQDDPLSVSFDFTPKILMAQRMEQQRQSERTLCGLPG